MTKEQEQELILDIKAFLMDGQPENAEVFVMQYQYDMLMQALKKTDIQHSLAVHLWHHSAIKDLFERCRAVILTQRHGAPPANLVDVVLQWQNEGAEKPAVAEGNVVDLSKN